MKYDNLKWKDVLFLEKKKEYFKNIIKFIIKSKNNGKIIYPDIKDIFNSFKLTKFKNIKVVIIGQDPYYKKEQANGLCFSVNKNIKIPNSLLNIFKEVKRDIKFFTLPNHGYLKNWAIQGVLLLNLILTVEENKPLSHENIGWKIFIKNVIKMINIYKHKIIFLLWGCYVRKNVKNLINKKKHYILCTSHPSPLSFKKGFWGCNHFSKVNKILKFNKIKEINWKL